MNSGTDLLKREHGNVRASSNCHITTGVVTLELLCFMEFPVSIKISTGAQRPDLDNCK